MQRAEMDVLLGLDDAARLAKSGRSSWSLAMTSATVPPPAAPMQP
ncbi:hypothetical protein P4123_10180 [Pseudomonas aeruginosa]|nr:hypothetical protein [Pseudomonas aeruginosa]